MSDKISFAIVCIICFTFFALGFVTYDCLFSEKESMNARITSLEKDMEKKILPQIYITHGVIYKTEGDIIVEDLGSSRLTYSR